ncbi:anti-sigma factor family protein [Dyella soli]|uniref:Anti-sigma factor n=1 Tax=Dyella soli TaxID=522319 RepID=A0A4R0YPP5_9GAMM|nr:anti-sigma factor [Dyella soli]TCI10806.1 anti-sigma factor [Dyella soli]
MMCDDARLLLHAYLDDELDAAHSASVARHMQECAACTARYAAYATLHKALAQPALYRRAPDALRQRWQPARVASVATASPRQPRRARMALAAAAGFAGALLLTSPGWFPAWRQPGGNDPVVAEAISGHLRSLQEQHLMDVVSTDQHTVKPWFEGKLDFSPQVRDLSGEGFPLIGGRLDALEGHTVAALVYKRRLHVINLYQWPAESARAAQEVQQQHGYTIIRWSADGMNYVAVSDVNQGDLRQFALAFQNQPATPGAR